MKYLNQEFHNIMAILKINLHQNTSMFIQHNLFGNSFLIVSNSDHQLTYKVFITNRYKTVNLINFLSMDKKSFKIVLNFLSLETFVRIDLLDKKVLSDDFVGHSINLNIFFRRC